ncbi:hypothetical protein J4210_05385 [Candidatus Woesearchaeota archaeon]|nr:hypothetical protein [Candidatus Woesearchaeota archaeon]
MKSRPFVIVLIFALILTIPLALAETKQVNLEAEIMKVQGEAVGQELSGPVARLFGDERINVHLKNGAGESIIGIITEDKKIQALSLNEVSDPSLEVYTDEKTVAQILISPNPLAQLQKALGEKKITYQAKGFFHKLKLKFVDLFVDVLKGADAGAVEEVDIEIVKALPAAEKKEEPNPEENTADDLTGGAVAAVPKSADIVVELTNYGFSPELLTLKAGDTVLFSNVRTGSVPSSQLIGTQACRKVKSGKLLPGDSFEWTFDQPLKCFFTDVYMTTKAMKVIVE